MINNFVSLTANEKKVFSRLKSPQKIQDFLDILPINFEESGETLHSPRNVLKFRKAHCFEGALFAAAVLYFHGEPPLLLDLQSHHSDESHVVALFRKNKKWGAISKTNHSVLRFRDAVYESPRELALSYFHEYFTDAGIKTLRSFAVFDLKKIKHNWITDPKYVWYIDHAMNKINHNKIISEKKSNSLRKASILEREASKLIEWKKKISRN